LAVFDCNYLIQLFVSKASGPDVKEEGQFSILASCNRLQIQEGQSNPIPLPLGDIALQAQLGITKSGKPYLSPYKRLQLKHIGSFLITFLLYTDIFLSSSDYILKLYGVTLETR